MEGNDAHIQETPAGLALDGASSDPSAGDRPLDFPLLAGHLKPLASEVRLRMLDLLTEPRYLEEIAQRLGISRQAVRKHLDRLLDMGVVVSRQPGPGATHSSEFLLNRLRIFQVQAEFQRLGRLRPRHAALDEPSTVERPTSPTVPRSFRAEPRLVMVRGLDEGTMHRLAVQPGRIWRLGRAEDVEVPVSYDPYASAEHAEIRCTPLGFLLVDRFSRNGTTLNGRLLLRGGESPIQPGDIIGVGKSLFVFQPGSAADPA